MQVTTGSDVYSFGVIMWSLYCGQHPYVSKGGFFVPNSLFPRFPAGAHPVYKSLALQCLLTDPHERPTFANISDVLQALLLSSPGSSEAGTPRAAPAPGPTSPSLALPLPPTSSLPAPARSGGLFPPAHLPSSSRMAPSSPEPPSAASSSFCIPAGSSLGPRGPASVASTVGMADMVAAVGAASARDDLAATTTHLASRTLLASTMFSRSSPSHININEEAVVTSGNAHFLSGES